MTDTEKRNVPFWRSLNYVVNVHPDLEEAIEASGFYWYPYLPERRPTNTDFPLLSFERSRVVNLTLVEFGRPIARNEAVTELVTGGLRPATARELVAFGRDFPDEEEWGPIVALFQTWTNPHRQFGGTYVLGLYGSTDRREFVRVDVRLVHDEFTRILAAPLFGE